MRTLTLGLAALALVASAVSGCSGEAGRAVDKHNKPAPTSPMTAITVPCARYAGVAQRITKAESDLYRTHDPAALATVLHELTGLEDGAPAAVRAALEELIAGFRTAQELLAHPNDAGSQKLARLAPALADAGRTVTAYVVSRCG